jgi:hypothetical protein
MLNKGGMAATNPTKATEEAEQSKARVCKVDERNTVLEEYQISAEESCNKALRNVLEVVTLEFQLEWKRIIKGTKN